MDLHDLDRHGTLALHRISAGLNEVPSLLASLVTWLTGGVTDTLHLAAQLVQNVGITGVGVAVVVVLVGVRLLRW